MQKSNRGDDYIKKFPKLNKWIKECLYCHQKGYDPSLPQKISTYENSLEVYYIKKYFKPIYLNREGICNICQRHINNSR